MKKKFLSIVMVLIMIISAVPVFADISEENITVYLSVSKYGEIVKDKNGNEMAYAEVNLSGKPAYSLDDVFSVAHKIYYIDGADGYASSNSEWGLGVDKLWGDTSYNFGYQINGGAQTVSDAGHIVANGDYIDAFIYKNAYPDTEGYAVFDVCKADASLGTAFEITLSYASGYDENWNTIFSACEGATITINGEETEFVTDENGKAFITFENIGTAIISATKYKSLNEELVPAITAPVTIVNVKDKPEIEIIHNIANMYKQIDFGEAGGNLPWIIADMAIYEELFPDSENALSDTQKDEALLHIVTTASEATKPGDLAKLILALRSLGYDARKILTKDFEKIDIVAKLTALIDNQDAGVTNIYTLPYVIIALSQAEGYATNEQMEYLITSALQNKSSWQSVADGTDALTPMVLALAPFYNTNDEVSAVIDESILILKSKQREDGLIDGFEGYEPASTGLAICALSAAGIDPDTVKNSENSLIYGLLSTANEDLSAFPNAFATEQGFRGLLAWRLLAENKGKIMYDFSSYTKDEANVSGSECCPVIFNVTPENAEVKISGAEEFLKNCFDLNEGSYTYTVAASGYRTKTDTLEITTEDMQNHNVKEISVRLSRVISGGGGSVSVKPDDDEQEDEEDETKEETQDIITNSPNAVFTEETFCDVHTDDWYYPAVKYTYENSLLSGTDKGFEPNIAMTRAMLVTVLYRLAAPAESIDNNQFVDVPENTWYTDSVKWAAESGIVSGISVNEFAPDTNITREQIATIIYRFALLNGYDTGEDDEVSTLFYNDSENISEFSMDAIKYAVHKGLMNGRGDNTFAPKENATRAEVATILMRFVEMKDNYNEEK